MSVFKATRSSPCFDEENFDIESVICQFICLDEESVIIYRQKVHFFIVLSIVMWSFTEQIIGLWQCNSKFVNQEARSWPFT